MSPALLADLITAVHLAAVIFVIAGPLLVVAGRLLGWGWIRNPWFRLGHLGVMGYISINTLRNELCFLTVWEWELRERAGQEGAEGSFLGKLLHDILFVDVAQATLNGIYLAFAALVLWTLWWVPPRFGTGREGAQSPRDHGHRFGRPVFATCLSSFRSGGRLARGRIAQHSALKERSTQPLKSEALSP